MMTIQRTDLPRRRDFVAALLVALVMLVVGLFLAGIGVKVLDLSGGAARDTSLVVAVAAFAISDFWGGGLLTTLTRAQTLQVVIAWSVVRAVLLLLIGLVAHRLLLVAPVQLALAVPAAWAGSRIAHKQLQMRRAIAADRRRHGSATAQPQE
jgi:hypothetical protein